MRISHRFLGKVMGFPRTFGNSGGISEDFWENWWDFQGFLGKVVEFQVVEFQAIFPTCFWPFFLVIFPQKPENSKFRVEFQEIFGTVLEAIFPVIFFSPKA